jgi:hypothetical protein
MAVSPEPDRANPRLQISEPGLHGWWHAEDTTMKRIVALGLAALLSGLKEM